MLGKGVANLSDGPGEIVAGDLDHDRHPSGAVSFINGLFIVDPLELAGAFLDGPFDVVLGHVLALGRFDGQSEA